MATVGRRKASVARVRFYANGDGSITINEKEYQVYFPYFVEQQLVREALELVQLPKASTVTVRVTGGGQRGQAESIRLGISRALVLHDPAYRPVLKSRKLLSVDSRVKERKKYGLKKARRAPQWQKR